MAQAAVYVAQRQRRAARRPDPQRRRRPHRGAARRSRSSSARPRPSGSRARRRPRDLRLGLRCRLRGDRAADQPGGHRRPLGGRARGRARLRRQRDRGAGAPACRPAARRARRSSRTATTPAPTASSRSVSSLSALAVALGAPHRRSADRPRDHARDPRGSRGTPGGPCARAERPPLLGQEEAEHEQGERVDQRRARAATASGTSSSLPATVSATAAPAAVNTRRHWYGVGNTRCAYQVIPRNIAEYAAAAATAEPIIP